MPKLDKPFTVRLEYSGLKITIEATEIDGIIDCYLIGASAIEKASELGHGDPKLFTTVLVPKTKR